MVRMPRNGWQGKVIRSRIKWLEPTTPENKLILFRYKHMEAARNRYHGFNNSKVDFLTTLRAYKDAVTAYHLTCQRYGKEAWWNVWE